MHEERRNRLAKSISPIYTWIRPSHDWLVLLALSPHKARGIWLKQIVGNEEKWFRNDFYHQTSKVYIPTPSFSFSFACITSVQHLCCLLWNGFSDPHLKKLRHKSVVKLVMDCMRCYSCATYFASNWLSAFTFVL